MARLTSRKWLSQQVVRGVEQRVIWTFNPPVDGALVVRPVIVMAINTPLRA
jgi:hypothetical protein